MKQLLYFLATAILSFSCNPKTESNKSNDKKVGTLLTNISTETAELGKYLDFTFYRPVKVKFKHIYLDNSHRKDSQVINEPSYSKLEAVLYFDSLTLDKILNGYIFSGFPSPIFDKKEFNFEWLDKDIKAELNQSDSSYKGSFDYLFGSKRNGGLWFFKQGILVYKTSN